MAAETLTADAAVAGVPLYMPKKGECAVAFGTYDIAANVEDGDIFEMVRIPGGTRVVAGWVVAEDLDTGTEALDMDIGWAGNGTEAADVDGFGNLGVWSGDPSVHLPVAGNRFPFAGKLQENGYQDFSAETVIQVEANAPANAGGTGQLTVVVLYTAQ